MDETEKKTYKAKLAEQVERYDGKANRRENGVERYL